ncbi:MAG: class I SAM-dependent methyltransferase, partial [Gaiellales bacterium]
MPDAPTDVEGAAIRDGAAAELLARYYDLDLEDDPGDLDLYLAMAAQADGAVLELAAGSGRVAVPLVSAGHAVVAVDHDPAMLDRARRRWAAEGPRQGAGTLELVEADLLGVDLGARFDLVILALNGLLLMGSAERQASALAALARHLRPGRGRAVVDVSLPAADELASYDGRIRLEWQRPDPETGRLVAKQSAASYDAATAVVELTTMFDTWPASGGAVERVTRVDQLRLIG